MSAIFPKDAKELAANLDAITRQQLDDCWASIAGQISYLNADDYGDDWKQVPLWRPTLGALDAEYERRGLEKPSRSGYLL